MRGLHDEKLGLDKAICKVGIATYSATNRMLRYRRCASQQAKSLGRSPSPHPQTLTCCHSRPWSCHLVVSTHAIYAISCITIHLPTPEGWKAELAQLADPQRTFYPQCGHLSTLVRHRSVKVLHPKTDVLTTKPRYQRRIEVGLHRGSQPLYAIKHKFHLARHDTTRHVRRVEPMHFGCVDLVKQHGSTCPTRLARLARHIERVVSCRDLT